MQQRKKRKNQAADAADWHAYFERIQTICPWSWSAWCNNSVDFQRWKGIWTPLEHHQVRVWLTPNHSRRMLKNLCGNLNEQVAEYEWLWSEPSYGAWATPTGCIIQQCAQQLQSIRSKLKDNEKSIRIPQ